MQVTITFQNANPNTIWGKLAAKLGREPTDAEVRADMQRITDEGMADRASRGKLRFQK